MPAINTKANTSLSNASHLLSLPLKSSYLHNLEMTSLAPHHQKCLKLMISNLENPGQEFLSALNEIIDTNGDRLDPATHKALHDLLQTNIYLEPELQPAQKLHYQHQNLIRTLSIEQLIGMFQPEQVELTGSSALDLLQGKPIPEHQDIDLFIYTHMQRFGQDPDTRNQNIVNQYAHQFGFTNDIKERCHLKFKNHAFGCTFKPTVSRSKKSRKIDITFVDTSLFPLQNQTQSESTARWDVLPSSFRITCPDRDTAIATNMLSIKAIAYLQEKGFFIFNTSMTQDSGLDRIQKAISKHYGTTENIPRGLQPNTLELYFSKAENWKQSEFKFINKNSSEIGFISFLELLDQYQIMYTEYHQNRLNIYDIASLEICFAQAGYTHLRSKSTTEQHRLDSLIFRLHILLATHKNEQAEKLFIQIVSKLASSQGLHKQSQIWIMNAFNNIDFQTLSLKTHELFNILNVSLEVKDEQLTQKTLQQFQSTIIHLKKTDKIRASKELKDLKQNILKLNTSDQLYLNQQLISLFPHEHFDQDIIKNFKSLDSSTIHLIQETLKIHDINAFKGVQVQLALLKLIQTHKIHLNQHTVFNLESLLQSLYSQANQQELKELHHFILKHKVYLKITSTQLLESIYSKTEPFGLNNEDQAIKGFLGLQLVNSKPKQAYELISQYIQKSNSQEQDQAIVSRYLQLMIQFNKKIEAFEFLNNMIASKSEVELHNPIYTQHLINLLGSIENPSDLEPEILQMIESLLPNIHLESSIPTIPQTSLIRLTQSFLQYLELPYKQATPQTMIKIENNVSILLNKGDMNPSIKKQIGIAMNRSICEALKLEADIFAFNHRNSEINSNAAHSLYEIALNTFLEIQDPKASDHNHIGEIYAFLKNAQKAHYHFEQAMSLDPLSVSSKLSLAIMHIDQDDEFDSSIKSHLRGIIDRNVQQKPIAIEYLLELITALKYRDKTQLSEDYRLNLASLILKQAFKSTLTSSNHLSFAAHKTILTLNQCKQLNAFEWVNQKMLHHLRQSPDQTQMLQLLVLSEAINKYLNLNHKASQYLTKTLSYQPLTQDEIQFFNVFYRFAHRQNDTFNAFKRPLNLILNNKGFINTIEMIYKPLFLAYIALLKNNHNGLMLIQLFRSSAIFDFNKVATMISTFPATPENTKAIIDALLNTLEILPFYTQTTETSQRDIRSIPKLQELYGEHLGEFYNIRSTLVSLLSLLTQTHLNQKLYHGMKDDISLKNLQAHRAMAKQIYSQEINQPVTPDTFILRHYFIMKSMKIKGQDYFKLSQDYPLALISMPETDLKEISQMALKILAKSKNNQLNIIKETRAISQLK